VKLVYALAIVATFVAPAFADNVSCVQYCDSNLNRCTDNASRGSVTSISNGASQQAQACRADYNHCVQMCR
jgi:hypothetical protein